MGVTKHLLMLLRNFTRLCPIRPVIAIPYYKEEVMTSMEMELNDLLACYFDNIHRVEDLNSLFPYIKDTADWLILWYE